MKKGSIRGILIVIYMIAMGVSLVIGLELYERVTASNNMAKSYVEDLEDARNLQYMLDASIKKTVDNSLELVFDENLCDVLSTGGSLTDGELSYSIDTWLIRNLEASSVYIINNQNQILSKSRVTAEAYTTQQINKEFSSQLLEQIEINKGEPYFGIFGGKLYIARRINSLENFESVGYLLVFLDKQVMLGDILDYVGQRKLHCILANEKGEFVNIYKGESIGEAYKTYKNRQMEPSQIEKWTKQYHHVELEENYLGLKLISKSFLVHKDNNIINIVIAILIINLLFLSVGSLVVKHYVIMPLEDISNKSKMIIQNEDLSIRFDARNSYMEADQIVQALNEMLDKINILISEGKQREKQQRILELSVVNHQVNPHFLFNTLNSVNVLIAMEDKKTATKLISSLAKYYRMCLNQEDTLSTVAQEINVAKEYINIMQLKNPNMLEVNFEVEEQLKAQKIPGMILQTLIENCIKYGIKTIDKPLKIEITVKMQRSKHRMAISVKDYGKGMQQQVRDKLMDDEKLKGKSGFGLRGTVKRIRLMYNVKDIKDILYIESELNEYTEVIIYIPLG